MYDVIENILMSRRAEARYAPLLGLVELLDQMGYEDSLLSVTAIADVSDDSNRLLEDTENLIITNSLHLARRLGVTIDKGINKDIGFLYHLIFGIVEGIDDYEDINELSDIIDSDEPAEIKLTLFAGLFGGKDFTDLAEQVEFVEQRLMDVLTNNIHARQRAEQDAERQVAQTDIRMGQFINILGVEHPATQFFTGEQYKTSKDDFINGLEIDDEGLDADQVVSLYGGIIAGIQLAFNDDFESAQDVEPVAESLVPDHHLDKTIRIVKAADLLVDSNYYGVEE